jgi:hypothetical protein
MSRQRDFEEQAWSEEAASGRFQVGRTSTHLQPYGQLTWPSPLVLGRSWAVDVFGGPAGVLVSHEYSRGVAWGV